MPFDKNRFDLTSVPRAYHPEEPVPHDGVTPVIRYKRVGPILQWALKENAAIGELVRNEPSPLPDSEWEPAASNASGGAEVVTVRRMYSGSNEITLPFTPQRIVGVFLYNYDTPNEITDFIDVQANDGETITEGYVWNGLNKVVFNTDLKTNDHVVFFLQRGGTGGGENPVPGEESIYRGPFTPQRVKKGWVFEAAAGGLYEAKSEFDANAEPVANAFWRKVNVGAGVGGGFTPSGTAQQYIKGDGTYGNLTDIVDATSEYELLLQVITPITNTNKKACTLTKVNFGLTLTDLKIQINSGPITTLTPTDNEWTGSIALPARASVKWIPTANQVYTDWTYQTTN